MATFRFGFVIKKRREDLRLTQEDLADGICSVPTLSRIENGERMPTKAHFDMLVQRLGLSDTILDSLVDERDFHLHELKYRIRQAIIEKRPIEAGKLLHEYEESLYSPSNIDEQFLILYQVIIFAKNFSTEEIQKKLEEAIYLTCPKFAVHHLPKLLSYEEISILNNLAINYAQTDQLDRAIEILYHVKRYYENHIVNPEEALRTQPMTLYNLSKCLGMAKRYNECISVCDEGIRIAKTTGRCSALAMTLYNRAWSLAKRNQDGDISLAKTYAEQAAYVASILGQHDISEHSQQFLKALSETQ